MKNSLDLALLERPLFGGFWKGGLYNLEDVIAYLERHEVKVKVTY